MLVNSALQVFVSIMSSETSSTTQIDACHRTIVYRQLAPTDIDEIKSIHNDLFPVKYSDSFFTSACAGRGMNDGELFTSIATYQGVIVG